MLRILAGRLAVLLVTACLSAFAGATAQRTFVRSDGVDNPSCSLAAPCRGFAAAIAQTSAGGEVIVLDSAGYGKVTITKSVTIAAPAGVYAGISVFSGDGITVAAGPTDKVVLRGLSLNGQGGLNGIIVSSAQEVHIEDCTAANFSGSGFAARAGTVHIVRSVARSNTFAGVYVLPSSAVTITATLTDTILASNGMGFYADSSVAGITIAAVLTRVTATRNSGTGFAAGTNNTGTVTMVIADSLAAENGANGLAVSGTNATAMVSGSTFARNVGSDLLQVVSGVIRTGGNNALSGRGAADVTGTLTTNALK